MPGSGKSTIGKHLARRFSIEFLDTDELIEKQLGYSVREYFDREGENRFREIESLVIESVAKKSGCVISTGGGAVLKVENRIALKENCRCVYLRTSPEDLFRRLRHDKKRPLLQVSDPLSVLKTMFIARDPLYMEVAKLVVDTGRPPLSNLVNLISKQLDIH